MGKHFHLVQRRRIFYWRRRIPGFSTGFDTINLSLRTEARAEAYIIARKPTAESDRMFDALTRNLLSPEAIRDWLSHVITEELARIRRVHLVTQMDPVGSHAEDERADWATATAWKLMAEFGPRAKLDARVIERLSGAGASEADLASLETTLAMLASDMLSEARMRRIKSGFKALTGVEEPLGSTELLELRQLLIHGRAAAHAPRESVVNADSAAAGALAQDIAGGMAAARYEALARARPVQGPEGAVERKPQPAPPILPPPSATAPMPEPASEIFDTSVMATVGRLNTQRLEQRKKERQHKTQPDGTPELVPTDMENSRRATARLFVQVTGVSDIRGIGAAHISQFRDALSRLPNSWGKRKEDATSPIEEAYRRAESLPPAKVGFAAATINRHLDVMGLILGRAEEDGIAVDPKALPKKLRMREVKRARDKRPGFKPDHMAALFGHTIWTGCQGSRARNLPGKRILKDGLYWVPLIAAYSGARREELAGLMCEDIKVEDGVVYFDIRENANRGVKTLAGERRIPVHERLIALGFLDYVERIRRRKETDLFPELRPRNQVKGSGSKFGAAIYDRFADALKLVFDGNAQRFVTHSFRHYVNDKLSRDVTIPKVVRVELIGHEGEDTNERVYVEPSPIRDLQVAINRLPVVEHLV